MDLRKRIARKARKAKENMTTQKAFVKEVVESYKKSKVREGKTFYSVELQMRKAYFGKKAQQQ